MALARIWRNPTDAKPLLREHPTYFYSLVSMSGKGGENDLCA